MSKNEYIIQGNIVDVVNRRIFKGEVLVEGGKIKSVSPKDVDIEDFILPGFIDSHVHIESSMLVPSEFARAAVAHGTVATVSDPHEIANVLGKKGVDFMIENAKRVPFKFFFGAPSCVPASPFETSGAVLDAHDIEELLDREDIFYLAEMMNFPGVLFKDEQVMKKLSLAKRTEKPVDGHAPGLVGEDAKKYANAGITTDHECFSKEEAISKIKAGMKIQIREGSAAKNFDELVELIDEYPGSVMLCSDDKHPDDLIQGHINLLVNRGLEKGLDFFNLLRTVTLIPKNHYNLNIGLLQEGDDADFIIVDSLENFKVRETYIKGVNVFKNGVVKIERADINAENKFYVNNIQLSDIQVEAKADTINVIEVLEGQLITKSKSVKAKIHEGKVIQDIENDVLKTTVLNRYQEAKPEIGFIHNFGLKRGAIASTVAHDSHNIIAVGSNDKDLLKAIELLNESKGGIVAVDGHDYKLLPLPVAGIMAIDDAQIVAQKYEAIDRMAKSFGCKLRAPFMSLSFMALLVIPELKLSDKGLFDGIKFSFTSLFDM